ncbi:hypothetical protein SCUP234_05197 [Seiridium cupressi]
MQQTPAIPPRPSRSQDKDNGSSIPAIPPRPAKRFNRSISPNPDRFAPSPLNESPFAPKSPGRRTSGTMLSADPIERPGSVSIPSIGQEGQEYAAVTDELSSSPENQRAVSPEQTRTIGEDVKLHAPKPKLPQEAAKQRVAAVTRTDSDRAASFGIGRPSSEDPYPRTLKKKASTTSQLSHDSHVDDEQGIPEIGIRVPLLGHAGDIQAPTPGPGSSSTPDLPKSSTRHHTRKTSGRSTFGQLPPDSYGLHGHGVEHTDKLEKAYYEKHPEAKQFDLRNHHLHDRVKDYHMSSEELNKLVRDSSGGAGFGSTEYVGTPSEQVGFQATEEYTSRMSSPRPASAASKRPDSYAESPLKKSSMPDISVSAAEGEQEQEEDDDDVIHVDDPARRGGFAKYGNAQTVVRDATEGDYEAPILAPDEVAKRSSHYDTPAVELPPERRGSSFEMEQPRSRPTSRPGSIYSPPPPEIRSTPLDDVEEYEPLFPEDEKSQKKAIAAAKLKEIRQRFPSRDIWEDAPDSVHGTAEVSTPEPSEGFKKPEESISDIVPREGETAAQAFARKQEELAESEDRSPDSFLRNKARPRSWAEAQPHLAKEMNQFGRPSMAQRFPSRDVWEDTPDSLRLETTVSTPQSEKDPQSAAADVSPVEKQEKPTVPARPVKKLSGDDKPTIPDRPKPQIPARPAKPAATESKEAEAAPRQKPAVPARPVGGKIAALQAGFMSDLNKRLQLGPQAPKKDEPKEEEPAEEKEKAPLVDARKGRARGPQRRAPTKSSSPSGAAPPVSNGRPTLSFSTTRTLWCINEEGTMNVEQEEEPYEEDAKPVDGSKQSEEPSKESEQEVGTTAEGSDKASEPTASTNTSTNTTTGTTETKTLATNTAGESILEETVDKKPEGDQVADVEEIKDDVVDS